MKRKIIHIDEEKCTGCGLCIPDCPEGAIQIMDGKARLISDLMCDGLGACLNTCPEGAISIEEREAEKYDEEKVIANMVKLGPQIIAAHLHHLDEHNQLEYAEIAREYLKAHDINISLEEGNQVSQTHPSGCPGSRAFEFHNKGKPIEKEEHTSALTHWPIQMHLISPHAPHYQGSDLLLAADCVAYTMGNFHQNYLNAKTLAIACPKLDVNKEIYVEKIKALIEDAKIEAITVMIMQVPCCSGLIHITKEAQNQAQRKVPIKQITVSLQGEILDELEF